MGYKEIKKQEGVIKLLNNNPNKISMNKIRTINRKWAKKRPNPLYLGLKTNK
jgi:hypothetical protein